MCRDQHLSGSTRRCVFTYIDESKAGSVYECTRCYELTVLANAEATELTEDERAYFQLVLV